jgi:ferredoxin
MPDAYPKNALGPFYIENGCCIACGVPVDIAPDLFRWDEEIEYPGHCFVARQPANGDEVDLMLKVMKHVDIDCLRYRGNDDELRRRIVREGHADQCD